MVSCHLTETFSRVMCTWYQGPGLIKGIFMILFSILCCGIRIIVNVYF